MHANLPIVTAAEMRAAEAAMAATGVSLATLRERAGAALGALAWRIASGRPVRILCGPGNNGGDGYAAARWLTQRGVETAVMASAPPATDLARAAAAAWSGEVLGLEADILPGALVVDCLFGTGLSRPLDGMTAMLLQRHGEAAAAILSADVPSGIGSDSGDRLGCPIVADHTLAFGALKPAHMLHPGAAHCGQVHVADLGMEISSTVRVAAFPALAAPGPNDHKYTRGLVAVVAGAMGGAAELAARGAQAGGAGYVRLIGSRLPPAAPWSIVRQGWRDGSSLADPRIGAIVIGCGLGQGEDAAGRFAAALASGRPLVIDADALALLPPNGVTSPTILTPHAGEFARIAPDYSGSKISRTRALAHATGATVVHKGPDTVVAAPDGRVAVAPAASPWLATAGTGDVLAGMCGAMLAQGLAPLEAAQAAVLLHARAAACAGPGLTADDLVERSVLA